ncbi:MAG: hypothetical protein U0519_01970 [Candidatus Gracilibacteria bacterium]
MKKRKAIVIDAQGADDETIKLAAEACLLAPSSDRRGKVENRSTLLKRNRPKKSFEHETKSPGQLIKGFLGCELAGRQNQE